MSILKSLRDRLFGGTSTSEESDPDEVVEAGSVGYAQGPMVVSRLGDIGIRATTLDQRRGGIAMVPRSKVVVLGRDRDRASQLIDEFVRENPSRDIDY
jgi:hypothetical protein